MKVIVYEGLFGIALGSKMSKAFELAMPGVAYERRSWTDKRAIPKGAIILSHSFGGYTAWAKCMEKDNHKYLITVDMRWWFGNKDFGRGFLNRHTNFFQLSGLRGYRLSESNNVEIKENNLGGFGHMRLPSHPTVIKEIKRVCGLL